MSWSAGFDFTELGSTERLKSGDNSPTEVTESTLMNEVIHQLKCLKNQGFSYLWTIRWALKIDFFTPPPTRGLALKSALLGRILGTVDAIRRYWPPGAIPECSVRGELTCTGHHAELIITGDHTVPELPKSSSIDRTGGFAVTTTPTLCFDSIQEVGGNTEVGFGGEEDEDDEDVVDSSQKRSGESGFLNGQDLFITLDLEPVCPEPTQGRLPDPEGGEGTSVNSLDSEGDCNQFASSRGTKDKPLRIGSKGKMYTECSF
ncbi:hypothetical protein UY3_04931 [Chelonia mydas]|uniref:Uncharacterized protein n=1 Tax=Chelonia mydas TaxID=8469 RepID=M7BIZ7_CHEMY|nr:hypothetical protein UY3_04931 [Chelonia mydas]